VENLLPRMNYAHEILGTQGGALLPWRVPAADPRGKKSLVCIGLEST